MSYTIPAQDRADFRKMIKRANRRVLSNIKFIDEQQIRDNQIKTNLIGDFGSKKKWGTKTAPFSSSTKFSSEKEYQDFLRYVSRWGEDTGTRGGHKADPRRMEKAWRSSIYKSLNGLARDKGISLEEWGGDLPPDVLRQIDRMTLEQMSHFYRYIDPSGNVEEFDSDQVDAENVDDFIDYIRQQLGAIEKFYPAAAKKQTKRKTRKKTRKKKKGRKK